MYVSLVVALIVGPIAFVIVTVSPVRRSGFQLPVALELLGRAGRHL